MKMNWTSSPLRQFVIAFASLALPVAANAGILGEIFGGSPSSGKIAKYSFTLNESFPVTSIAWSPDGRYIADSSTQSSFVNVWDVQQRRLVHHFKFDGANSKFHSLSFSPDSRHLAFCDGMSTLWVYSTDSWEPIHTQGRQQSGFCLGRPVFSSDGKLLAINGREFLVFNTSDWSLWKTIDANWLRGRDIATYSFSPGNHDIFMGGSADFPEHVGLPRLRSAGLVWKIRADEVKPSRTIVAYPVAEGRRFNSTVISMIFSADGNSLITGAQTGAGTPSEVITDALHLIEVSTGEIRAHVLDGVAQGEQYGLEISFNEKYIICGDSNPRAPKIYLVDFNKFTQLESIDVGGTVYDVAADPLEGGFAAAAGSKIIFWKIKG